MNQHRGFSLIELVVVIVVLGIVAAVVIPRWQGGSGFDARALHDQIVAALRYAQKSAIAARRTVCVSFASSTQISFAISNAYPATDCSAGTALVGPDGGVLTVTASGTNSFAASPASLTFDAAGRPGSAASIAVAGLPSALNIVVEAETGYVH